MSLKATMDPVKDYFSEYNGQRYAGLHLLVDLWDTSSLDDQLRIETALRSAAQAAGAKVLHEHFHVFTPQGGITGILLLAESHITIHTWPERGFAAIDLFMCGSCDPRDSLPTLKLVFAPGEMQVREIRRGLII